MYQFIYLVGPGVASWLVGEIYSGFRNEADAGSFRVFLTVARVIAYALVNVAIVSVICKPLGKVQFVVLQDGSITVHYGASALMVAVAVAIVTGVVMTVMEHRHSNDG